jgi:hypothetical protein
MTANINPDTGIAYGYISANQMDSDTVQWLLYDCGTDLSYEDALFDLRIEAEGAADEIEEECRTALEEVGGFTPYEFDSRLEHDIEAAYESRGYAHREHFIEEFIERESEYLQIDEPIIEGECEGVKYRTSWLGGALNFFIFESPVTGFFEACSPCVPNAANIGCPDPNGVEGYSVPLDWLYRREHGEASGT